MYKQACLQGSNLAVVLHVNAKSCEMRHLAFSW